MASDLAQTDESSRSRLDLGALMVAGAGLLSVQYVAARELGSTFFVTELSIGAAVLVTLLGPSLGYALGARLLPSARAARLVRVWAAAAVLLHLALPVGIRGLVAVLGPARPILSGVAVAIAVTLVCAYYALLLPLRATGSSLARLYGAELCGAMAALLLFAAAPSFHIFLLGYCALPVAAMYFAASRKWTVGAAMVATCAWLLYPSLDGRAARRYYQSHHGHKAPRIVQTSYSAYQRIDVIEDGGELSLYLDGVPFYRGGELAAFNEFLAEVPGALRPSTGRALVLGSGSFSSAARLHRLGYKVTVVELDGAVAAVGLRHFRAIHGLSPSDITLHIEDGRRLLARSAERYDLIVLDVPAPYRVQTALLHTPEFYRQVAAHLAPGGVASISLCDGVSGLIGRRIAAAALAVFPDVLAVESESVGLGILYAAQQLPFREGAVADALRARDPLGGRVFPHAAIAREALGATPISGKNLFGVLLLARQAMLIP